MSKLINTKADSRESSPNDLLTTTVLRVKGTYYRSGVACVPTGQAGRKETGGPLVDGPWAYCFQLCSVIDTNGGTGAEVEANEAAGLEHEVEDGDSVFVDGNLYVVRIERNQYIHLDAAPKTEEAPVAPKAEYESTRDELGYTMANAMASRMQFWMTKEYRVVTTYPWELKVAKGHGVEERGIRVRLAVNDSKLVMWAMDRDTGPPEVFEVFDQAMRESSMAVAV